MNRAKGKAMIWVAQVFLAVVLCFCGSFLYVAEQVDAAVASPRNKKHQAK